MNLLQKSHLETNTVLYKDLITKRIMSMKA
jgi:hypothetical protein